eukprot:TRINITY_DN25275_c0_g1_i1.p1 TRINITY_DN25275_c0_g1~~TRINITY_DN25275_c0_g1_i1.p1  ORF type:complete len:935 (-),score=183.40 TRINITY_DN25275_c0_g1_i1:30-2834(-)
MFRYVAGKQTFYPPKIPPGEGVPDDLRSRFRSFGFGKKRETKELLTEEQRARLQDFLERFDAAAGAEPALRLVAAELHGFGAFQACKILQKVAKRFGAALARDHRLARLVEKCAACMPTADGVSLSRALWATGRFGLRDGALLKAAAARIPEVIGDCGPITMATIWHAFETLEFAPAECLDFMAQEMLRRIDDCDPPEIGIVLHAAAMLRFPSQEKLFAALVPHVCEHQGTFSLRHLAVCLHAAARVGLRNDTLCQRVAERFMDSAGDADTLAFVSAVYACALVAYVNQPFLESAARFIERALGAGGRGLEPQQLANLIYAFGKLDFSPERALVAACQQTIQDMPKFKGQELSNFTYGLGLLKFRHDPFLGRLCRHLVEEGRAQTLDAQSIVSIVYAFGLIGHCHHTTLRLLGDLCIPKLPDFKPEEYSIMVYSLGLVNFRHHDFLNALVLHVPPVLPRFSTQNLSNFLHGLGLVAYDRDDAFVASIASHLASRLRECKPQDIANPITALMRMCIPHDGLLSAVARFITSPNSLLPLKDFTPQEIANTVYGFDALQFFDAILFQQVADETEKRLAEFIPQEVANIIWAFSKQSFGTLDWFERVLARCVPHAGATSARSSGHTISAEWCAEDLEKPLGALWPVRHQIPSYACMEKVFRARFFDRIADFLRSIAPPLEKPAPAQYQKDFAAWDLYQVGPLFTEELFGRVDVSRVSPIQATMQALLAHYVGPEPESLLSRYGDKMLLSVLPAARWLSSHVRYRLVCASAPEQAALEGQLVVEAAHPKEDVEGTNQRRVSAEAWREAVDGAPAANVFRPVLLSTFLGNARHRHTELVVLDMLVSLAVDAVTSGRWRWCDDFWSQLSGEVEVFVPHTPCLSCVGVFAQLKRWTPNLRIRVAYEDWRDWRRRLFEATGRSCGQRTTAMVNGASNGCANGH